MVLHELKQSLAKIFEVDAALIGLDVIDGGLSHKSYRCSVSNKKYYIKEYNKIHNIVNVLNYINKLTNYMLDQGIPASHVLFYSPEFPNIVVHEYVDGKPASGEFSQMPAIASLYSKVAMVGKRHGKYLSKPEYLSTIQSIMTQLEAPGYQHAQVDVAIHDGMLRLIQTVYAALQTSMPEQELLHIRVHDDFTENNILMDGDEVKLLCDWDSYRPRYCNEHIASTATRFSTDRPLDGFLQQDKLVYFLQMLNPELFENAPDIEAFAALFPYWATLKHIRAYHFRSAVVYRKRPDLKQSLLAWPLQHCVWMIENRQQVSDWVGKALPSG